MKIQFDPNLDFQRQAINAVVDLFDGQEICQTNFTVAPLKQMDGLFAGMDQNDLDIGNRLRLLDEDIHKNVKAVQLRNGLAPSEMLGQVRNFATSDYIQIMVINIDAFRKSLCRCFPL